MAYIYKIVNSVNDKVYIGQTIKKPKLRLTEHIYHATHPKYGYKSKLHAAMRKYGIDAFRIETVEVCDVSELNDREIYWIEKYDSYRNGYNNTLGGGGSSKEIDESYICFWNNGLTVSEIAREIGSGRETVKYHLSLMGVSDKDFSKRQSERMSDKTGKVIYQYDMDGNYIASYKSAVAASKATNINIHCIRGVLSKQHQTAGNYQWSRTKTDNIGKVDEKFSFYKKKVLQYTTDGELVAVHESINQARIAVGLSSTLPIKRVCNGETHTSKGYVWKYG